MRTYPAATRAGLRLEVRSFLAYQRIFLDIGKHELYVAKRIAEITDMKWVSYRENRICVKIMRVSLGKSGVASTYKTFSIAPKTGSYAIW